MIDESQDHEQDQVEKETLKDLEAREGEDVKGGTLPPTHDGCVPDSKVRRLDPELTT